MTISTSVSPLIGLLEQQNDPALAYFSYGVDEHGERGIIRANKEGLRLYAIDLLKKSMQMEAIQDGQNICFQQQEWLVNDSGYNLISAVKPEYCSREEILSGKTTTGTKQTGNNSIRGCIGSFLLFLGSLFTLSTAFKSFR